MSRPVSHLYEFGPFRLDTVNRLLRRGGEVIVLKPKVFDTLLALVERSGYVLGKDDLMRIVWPDTVVEENNLSQNISAIRKALGEDKTSERYIETVPRRGYRFVAGVRELAGEETGLIVEKHTTARLIIEERAEGFAAGGEKDRRVSTPSPHRRPRLSRTVIAVGAGALLLAAVAFWVTNRPGPDETGGRVKFIAVLPFKPLNVEAGDEYLGLGMADTLITRLSNVSRLIVRPTSAVRKYAAQEADPVAAGRELGVESVLEGTIQKVGDRVRVNVQLVSVRDAVPLWADKFDEDFTDILAVEDAISARVAGALTLRLTGDEQELLAKHYTEDTEAHQAYLKGRFYWNKRTEETLRKGIEYFEQAVAKDPGYALAYAGLADSYILLGSFGLLPPKACYPRAQAAAQQALALDDALAEAHTSLGFVKYYFDWDWAGGEREFRRAIELNPNYPTGHHWYALYLATAGRMDEAIAEIRRAQKLDPVSLIINTDVGVVFFCARQFDQAIEQYRRALEMDPNFYHAHRLLRMVYEQKGMLEEALTEHLRESALAGKNDRETREEIAALKRAYAESGWKGYWQKRLDELKAQSKKKYVSPYAIAREYALLGDRDQAFTWLEKAYQDRVPELSNLKAAPAFDGLRSDPRHADLLRRIGMAK